MASRDDLLSFTLTDDERFLLSHGISEFWGQARATTPLASAMGFEDLGDLHRTGSMISTAIDSGAPLSRTDWTRALVAAEIVYASDVFGLGTEWVVINGGPEHFWIGVLRGLQEKIKTVHQHMAPPI